MWMIITKAWWHLPLSRPHKEAVKAIVFRSMPFLFRNSRAYRNWHEAQQWSLQQDHIKSMDTDDRTNVNLWKGSDSIYQPEPVPVEPITTLAVIIHAFHFEIFQEIIEYFKNNSGATFKFYVTCPSELSDKITGFFNQAHYKFSLLVVENHGRDILPFLKILPQAFKDGAQVILKIHTKKSDHRLSGKLWRKDLYTKLLKEKAIKQALNILNKDHSVGLIGPRGHIVPMNLYYGANAKRIKNLSNVMGIESSQLPGLNFSAGSMFYARRQALMPLLNLGLLTENFEQEQGQKDGTVAHAVERVFAISTLAANLKLVDTLYNPEKRELNITKDHPFTQ